MQYDPDIHHRRSIRLKGYDYSQVGLYFITICCQDKTYRFGKIENGEMMLNDCGKIAHDSWMTLSKNHPNVSLDVFQIMPNHIHGIVVLEDITKAISIGHIIGRYKTWVTHQCLKIYESQNGKMGQLWQRNYYEHIIRDNVSYHHIADYIINNPVRWMDDKWYM